MSMVKFDLNNLSSVKSEFNNYNNDILASLKVLLSEVDNMHQILNTPKLNENIPLIEDYMNKQIKYVNDNIAIFNGKFDNIISEYSSFIDEIKEIVGGSNAN